MKYLSMVLILSLIGTGLIFPGTITVNQPNGQTKWKAGNTYMINWTAVGCESSNYKINIFKDSITQANFKMQLTCSGVTTKSWKIPYNYKGNYIIRVKTDLPGDCQGDSAVFEVLESGIQLGVANDAVLQVKKKPVFKPKPGMFNPVITGILPVPLGALQAGTQLFVKGENFGTQKGKIFILGNFPGGKIELINVKWENSKQVNGVIPLSANGQPNQVVSVQVMTSYNTKSDPFGSPQFKGREEKVLTTDMVAVNHCGTDGNCNRCNNVSSCDDQFVVGCSGNYTICGYHINNWGTVGDDVGHDTYSINLQNGWTFKSINYLQWIKTSGDEKLTKPAPGFPVGGSNWTFTINWRVSPNDEVRYSIQIIVEGPIGTSYK